MIKKRLSKTLWYGTDVDSKGSPVIPPFTADPHDLEGLHVGELFLHFADKATLWTANESGNVVNISGGNGNIDLSKYLLTADFNKLWEIRYDSSGTSYIFGKLPLVTQYGITMYSGENVNVSGIYDGLPIDNTTIYWDVDSNGNKVLKAVVGSSGGGVADSVAWANVYGKPLWLTDDKPVYSYSEIKNTPDLSKYALASDIPSLNGYATEQWVLGKGYALASDLAKYIPIAGATEIVGEKNFIGGLKVNGSPIYYDAEKKYWKLEGDLLVTGGVTMFGNDSDFVSSTIMDAILYDDTTLGINANGELYVKGSVGGATTLGSLANVGSWADSVAPQDRIMYQAANSSQWVAKNLSDLAVGGVTGDYLPLTGGTIESSANFPLTIKRNNALGVGITFQNTAEKISIQAYDGLLSRIDNNNNGYRIWDSGNDGSGSGLDADLLDGLDATAFFYDKGASNSFDDKIYNGAYRTSSFKPNDAYGYGLVASFRSMETCAQIYFPDRNGEPQFRMQWNSQTSITSGWTALITSSSIGNYNAGSATKLATPRTIWGQSFDGTGNVSGTLSGVHDIDFASKGNYVVGTFDKNANTIYTNNIHSGKGNNLWLKSTADSYITNSDGTTKFLTILSSGNVGIGTTSPSQKLHVVGNILVTGGTTMYSARKLKNIQDERGLSLEELSVIKPTRFTWKDGRDNKIHIGGIADDVMKVLPEVIYKADNDTLTMDYGNAAFAIAASLIKPVVSHEGRIKVLEEENKRLKEEVEQLKWNIA